MTGGGADLDTALAELPGRAQRALARRWPGARLTRLEPLPGGISSLTFAAGLEAGGDGAGGGSSRGGGAPDGGSGGDGADPRRVVVKVAPPGLAPVRNRDVLRQARVLRVLHGLDGVSVPEVLADDDGSPPFFVMEFVAGEAYEPKWDLSDRPPAPGIVAARARAAARMLAALHAAPPSAIGLGDEPALSPVAELERWSALYATAGAELRGDEEVLAGALRARAPSIRPQPARVAHGDYRLGNMQFTGERLAAIIDWELWSVGDPRGDLAWLLTFADPVAQRVPIRDAANQAAADAMPDRSELLAAYAEAAAGRGGGPAAGSGGLGTPADLAWFEALCCYKLGAAMAVLAKRNRRRTDPDPGLELVARTTPPMLERGLELLGAGG